MNRPAVGRKYELDATLQGMAESMVRQADEFEALLNVRAGRVIVVVVVVGGGRSKATTSSGVCNVW